MGKSHITITISRQMGSGGSYIGYLAAKELGFKYIDREILHQAAERLGTDVGAIEYIDERSSGLMETIMKGFSFGTPETSTIHPVKRPVYNKDLYRIECKIMNEIADRYSAVIVGRGGFYALRNRPRLICVFIHAPQEFRVKRIMKAQERVKESDQNRAKFIRDMTGVDWADA